MHPVQRLERAAILTLLKVLLIHGKVQMFVCFVDDRVECLQERCLGAATKISRQNQSKSANQDKEKLEKN